MTLDIMWTCEKRFDNFIPQIDGMQWIFSFFDAVETLTKNSGLLPLLNNAFLGAKKMLLSKIF